MQVKAKSKCNAGVSLSVRMAMFSATILMSASALASELHWSKDPSTQCSFVAPQALTDASKYWIGPCPDGKASGIGMIRARKGSEAGAAFYGEVKEGVPVIGVVDLNGAYQAGRFSGRDLGQGDIVWQDTQDSFEAAVRAAHNVSEHYALANNKASADYYRTVAKQLKTQLDRD